MDEPAAGDPVFRVRNLAKTYGTGEVQVRALHDVSLDVAAGVSKRPAMFTRQTSRSTDGTMTELLKQAGRELLLLESSDWQFLISTWSAHDYASARVRHHYDDYRFVARLAREVAAGASLSPEQEEQFAAICDRDRPFPDLDPHWWLPGATKSAPSTGPV